MIQRPDIVNSVFTETLIVVFNYVLIWKSFNFYQSISFPDKKPLILMN